jgi:hypothetical protein
MEEIRNKVKESGLIQMDLADFKSDLDIMEIDLADQLWQGLVLKEKDFRNWVSSNDWSIYNNKAVCIFCSADAIIPTWAYMLVATQLINSAVNIVGTRTQLERELIRRKIAELDTDPFVDGRVIIKGCSDITDPAYAMTELVNHLMPVVKSVMYGEPCSTVPIYKRK